MPRSGRRNVSPMPRVVVFHAAPAASRSSTVRPMRHGAEGRVGGAAKAAAQGCPQVLANQVVIEGAAGHFDRLEAVEFGAAILRLGPEEEIRLAHAGDTKCEVHAGACSGCWAICLRKIGGQGQGCVMPCGDLHGIFNLVRLPCRHAGPHTATPDSADPMDRRAGAGR